MAAIASNHQPHDCLFNRLFRRRSKKTSNLRVTGLCVGNSPGPVNSLHKGPVTRKMFPFDDVIMVYDDINITQHQQLHHDLLVATRHVLIWQQHNWFRTLTVQSNIAKILQWRHMSVVVSQITDSSNFCQQAASYYLKQWWQLTDMCTCHQPWMRLITEAESFTISFHDEICVNS